MRILIVSRWLWEEHRRHGQTPGFFGELFQAVAAQGLELTILSQAADAGLRPEPRPFDGLNVHVFSRDARRPACSPLDKMIKLWAGYRKAVTDAAVIRRFVRQHGPFHAVVAQCEEPDGLACAIASLLGRFPPLITHVHGLRYKLENGNLRFTRQSSLGFIFRRSTRVVANSVRTADWLHHDYAVPKNKIGQCRIHLIAPFLNLATTRTARQGLVRNRILFLGALNRNKAPDLFLRAALLLAPDFPGWTFVLVGRETTEDLSFRATLHQLASHPLLANRLEWLGHLDPTSVIDHIRQARVVVCPSWMETFSRTTVEALALGRPVVVTETTGAAHWIKLTGSGSVVPRNDPTALASAIRDWTSRKYVPDASARIKAELTAARAAEDWIRETRATIHRPGI